MKLPSVKDQAVQAGGVSVPGLKGGAVCVRAVKTRSRPQDEIEDPLFLGSLALLGVG